MSYRLPLLLFLILLLANLIGCGDPRFSQSTTYGSTGWNSVGDEEAVPGVDHAMLRWCLHGDDLVYVVWIDYRGGGGTSSGGSGSSSAGKIHDQLRIESSDDQRFDFEYMLDTTTNEVHNTGSLRIGGVDYPLSNGALVLVSTQGADPKVKQIDLPASIITVLSDESSDEIDNDFEFETFATENSEINSFFKSHAGE